jgi:hypothetical protein
MIEDLADQVKVLILLVVRIGAYCCRRRGVRFGL